MALYQTCVFDFNKAICNGYQSTMLILYFLSIGVQMTNIRQSPTAGPENAHLARSSYNSSQKSKGQGLLQGIHSKVATGQWCRAGGGLRGAQPPSYV